MTSIGWEFYGIKFSLFITMAVSVVMYLYVMFSVTRNRQLSHLDAMAGDEGDD